MRAVLSLTLIFAAAPASAHGFGQRYDLPLPLELFVTGGAAVVFLSFVIAALFMRPGAAARTHSRLEITGSAIGRCVVHPIMLGLVRTLAAIVFLATLVGGYVGVANPYRNITVVMIWVIGWVGLTFVSALIGNVWALINPWRILFAWAERLAGRPLSRNLLYPTALGVWPAFALFLAFAWGEINWSGSGIPLNLSVALTAYSVITWTGMAVFGRETWLRHGEPFSIVFGLFARFAITEAGKHEGRVRVWLRPPTVGLLIDEPPSISMIAFVLLVLATVTYDGVTETEAFQAVAVALFQHPQVLGTLAVAAVGMLALLSFPLVFLIAYFVFAALMWVAGGRVVSLTRVSASFIHSLVPIAIAYHLAHYLSLLALEGQNFLVLLSDPFGFGWDLFGTADYRVDLALIDAGFVWYFSVVVIVAGHIAGVYLAHAEAMRMFADRRRAFASQIPMLILMVGYTMLSLWIIAQPIVA